MLHDALTSWWFRQLALPTIVVVVTVGLRALARAPGQWGSLTAEDFNVGIDFAVVSLFSGLVNFVDELARGDLSHAGQDRLLQQVIECLLIALTAPLLAVYQRARGWRAKRSAPTATHPAGRQRVGGYEIKVGAGLVPVLFYGLGCLSVVALSARR